MCPVNHTYFQYCVYLVQGTSQIGRDERGKSQNLLSSSKYTSKYTFACCWLKKKNCCMESCRYSTMLNILNSDIIARQKAQSARFRVALRTHRRAAYADKELITKVCTSGFLFLCQKPHVDLSIEVHNACKGASTRPLLFFFFPPHVTALACRPEHR